MLKWKAEVRLFLQTNWRRFKKKIEKFYYVKKQLSPEELEKKEESRREIEKKNRIYKE